MGWGSMFYVWEEEAYLVIRRVNYSGDCYVCALLTHFLYLLGLKLNYISTLSCRLMWPGDWIVANGKWVAHKTLLCLIQHSLSLFTDLNQSILKPLGMVEAWGRKKLCLKCFPIDMCEGKINVVILRHWNWGFHLLH